MNLCTGQYFWSVNHLERRECREQTIYTLYPPTCHANPPATHCPSTCHTFKLLTITVPQSFSLEQQHSKQKILTFISTHTHSFYIHLQYLHLVHGLPVHTVCALYNKCTINYGSMSTDNHHQILDLILLLCSKTLDVIIFYFRDTFPNISLVSNATVYLGYRYICDNSNILFAMKGFAGLQHNSMRYAM